jgi:hypothetical protein
MEDQADRVGLRYAYEGGYNVRRPHTCGSEYFSGMAKLTAGAIFSWAITLG